ncbi:phosphate regulon sensor histidine kinase PhoR [Thioalkalivibrio sp.]|uniref:phosphate regulon sensor histidine kinase PhoR n=1 Tax=Thioalkalivibrio sp. TaxID=2093813 RepID=UPI0035649303
MHPRKTWPNLVLTSALIALPILALGWATGQFWPTVAFLLAAALAWNIYNLLSLEAWLRLGGRSEPAETGGIWGLVFDHLVRRRNHHERRVHRLRQLVERYRDSVKAMPDAVIILRADYRIEWVNDAAPDMLGITWPRDEGQRITHLLRYPGFLDFMGAPGNPDRSATHTITLPSPLMDDRWLEMRLIPYGERQFLLLTRDTTQLHRLEVIRRDFVANVSHELRTPLTVLYGIAETLEEDLNNQPEQLRSVQMLREHSERMKLLVDDLLLLSRLEIDREKGTQDWFQPAPLLKELAEEPSLVSGEQQHDIRLDTDPTLELYGNRNELRSACANLLFNAVKYTPAGTRITLSWHEDTNGASLSVEDTGPGIASHHIPRLTERFYRVDNGRTQSRGGTGLGLAIVKHVLLRHDGHLAIDSQIGRGSRFTCRFPRGRVRRIDTRQDSV